MRHNASLSIQAKLAYLQAVRRGRCITENSWSHPVFVFNQEYGLMVNVTCLKQPFCAAHIVAMLRKMSFTIRRNHHEKIFFDLYRKYK